MTEVEKGHTASTSNSVTTYSNRVKEHRKQLTDAHKLDTLEKVKDYLRALGTGQKIPFEVEAGICCALWVRGAHLPNEAYANWPYSSADPSYPVPSPVFNRSASEAYNRAKPIEMWFRGPYAENRRELCLWLADNLTDDSGVVFLKI